MLRTPRQEEWDLFKHHASRVKEFVLLEAGEDRNWKAAPWEVHENCYQTLQNCFSPGLVLPNLQSFRISAYAFMKYAPLFLHPSLRRVMGPYGTTQEHKESNISYLYSIAQSSPFVEEFLLEDAFKTFDWGSVEDEADNDGPLQVAMNYTLRSLYNLSTVRTDATLTRKTLVHLGSLDCLTKLQLTLDDLDYGAILSVSPPMPKFTALHTLCIKSSAENIEPLCSFLRSVSSGVLAKIGIFLDFFCHERILDPYPTYDDTYLPPTAESLYALFSSLSNFTNLEYLAIMLLSSSPNLEENRVTGDTLTPLLRLKGIKTLDLRDMSFSLTSADIQDIARCLPELEDLNLGGMNGECAATVRPRDLLHFVRHCPSLKSLSLPLVCDSEHEALCLHEGVLADLPRSSLQFIKVGKSTVITEPASLAAFISGVFPQAKLVTALASAEACDNDELEPWM